jgi:ATP-dependent Clp protease ATP-binding subunit ClpB
MDLNKFTIKSQEALQEAQTKAIKFGHQEVDAEHLLLALLEQSGGLVPRVLQRMEIPVAQFSDRLLQELEKRQRISGPGTEPGKVYITQRLNKLLVKAQDEAHKLKDEYVSVEHILLAFIDEGSSTPAGKVFKEFNMTRDSLLKTLTAVRGHQRVTSADPEGTCITEIRPGTGSGSPQRQTRSGDRPRR